MKRVHLSSAALALLLVAVGVVALPGTLQAQGKDRDVITRAELLKSAQKSRDLFEAIRSLRPRFISPLTTRSQGAQSRALPRPAVFVDGAFAGELDVLRGIVVDNVEEVRFKSPSEAAGELGSRAPGGAILVTLRKKP